MQKKKKIEGGGARSRDRVRGSVGLGIGIGGVNRVSNRDRVKGGGEHVTVFEKHSPPPKKRGKITYIVRKKLTSKIIKLTEKQKINCNIYTVHKVLSMCNSQSLCVHVWLAFSQIAPLECLFELHSISTLL